MENALTSIFALGWLDIFNPVAISIVIILLTSVRKRSHTLLYIFGAYVAYVSASIAIFFGVDRYLLGLIKSLLLKFPVVCSVALIVVGVAALVGCVMMVLSLIRAIKNKREITIQNMFLIKSIKPWFILLLAFGSTWSCMFSAFAMLAFIGVLVLNSVPMVSAIWMISIFGLFSIIPTLSIYLLATRLKERRFTRIVDIFSKIANRICFYSIPIVLAAITVWSLVTGIGRLVG